MTITEIEQVFEEQRHDIGRAGSVKEVVAIYCRDMPERIRKEYERQLTKRVHHLFKGSLEKTRAHFIKQVNKDEHIWEESLQEIL